MASNVIRNLVSERPSGVVYRPAEPTSTAAAELAFIGVLAGEGGAPEGFLTKSLDDHFGPLMVLRESEPAGQGLYVLREKGVPVLLSVPHRFKDLGTGRIGALLMEEAPYRAVAFNTVPRDYEVSGEQINADLAHIAVSQFNAFHLAFVRSVPGARIVQLHGYAVEKRRTRAGRNAEVIISSGGQIPTTTAEALAECLEALGLRVALYPRDVTELGATTNTNRAALVAAGYADRFVHVEMSRQLRDALQSDNYLRRRFSSCLRLEP